MFRSPIINATSIGVTPAAAKLLQQAFDSIAASLRDVERNVAVAAGDIRITQSQVINVSSGASDNGGLLARVPAVDLTSTGSTKVFEALEGSYIILDTVVRITSASGLAADGGPYVSVGSTAGAANIFGSRKLRGSLAAATVVTLGAPGTRPQTGLGDAVYFNVDTGATATALTATIDVFGYAL